MQSGIVIVPTCESEMQCGILFGFLSMMTLDSFYKYKPCPRKEMHQEFKHLFDLRKESDGGDDPKNNFRFW